MSSSSRGKAPGPHGLFRERRVLFLGVEVVAVAVRRSMPLLLCPPQSLRPPSNAPPPQLQSSHPQWLLWLHRLSCQAPWTAGARLGRKMARRLAMLAAGAMSMEGWGYCLVHLCRRVWGLRRPGSRGRGVGLGRLLGGMRLWKRMVLCRLRRWRMVWAWTRSSGSSLWCRMEQWQCLLETTGRRLLPPNRMEGALLSTTSRLDDLLSSILNHGVLLTLLPRRLRLVRSRRGISALWINCLASSDADSSRPLLRHGE